MIFKLSTLCRQLEPRIFKEKSSVFCAGDGAKVERRVFVFAPLGYIPRGAFSAGGVQLDKLILETMMIFI